MKHNFITTTNTASMLNFLLTEARESILNDNQNQIFQYLQTTPNHVISNYSTPVIVLSALAAELGLKLILQYNNIVKKTHNLEKLYNLLSNSDKLYIKKEIESNIENIDFYTELKNHKEAFEIWRYSHEKTRINASITFLLGLCIAINNLRKTNYS